MKFTLSGFNSILQKIVPFKNRVLVRVHEAGAGLDVQMRDIPFHGLQLARCVDDDFPRAGLLANFIVLLLSPSMPRATVTFSCGHSCEDSSDVRKDSLLNLAVRGDVDRFEFIVFVKGAGDFRQIFSREGLAAGENQDAQISTKRFGDLSISRVLIWSFLRGASSSCSVKKQCVQRMSHTEVTRMFNKPGENGFPRANLA